jgi:S-adenosylmethionine:tRNA ribosyltransferase-isomerase
MTDYQLSDFDYQLPPELIAQEPAKPRDTARLLVLDKTTGRIEHSKFYNLTNYLQAGDVLVVNDSKVFPARLFGHKKTSGGQVEVFLHQPRTGRRWECLVGGRVHEGLELEFAAGLHATLLNDNHDGTWEVEFNRQGKDFFKAINRLGLVPLPPYIKRPDSLETDRRNYQTVYANEAKIGSAAAPTAGLHFTKRLLKKIKTQGVIIEKVTLHVGLGTFAPVKTDNISEHKMHSEHIQISPAVARRLKQAKQEGRRIIAVGTTSARTLETWGQAGAPASGLTTWTEIFIRPGYQFTIVDSLITNFHLPKSTLLMLIAALAGKDAIDKAYQIALSQKYRFFSYGDAMFITDIR